MQNALFLSPHFPRSRPRWLALPRAAADRRLTTLGELGRGEALTLRVARSAELQVCRHALWMTLSGGGQSRDADRVLLAGDVITLMPGSEWVLEPLLQSSPLNQEKSSCFDNHEQKASFVIRPAC